MYFSTVGLTAVFFSLARSAALQSRADSGTATFYDSNLHGGACSFSTYTLPSGIYGTALSDSNWDNSGNCGACIQVTGPTGGSITAMIVDECPGCGLNHLDLFPDAFQVFAQPSVGVIQTTWEYIDCPITTPLQLHIKDGASQWWFSMQVVNANKRVQSLEVSRDGGSTWISTDRQSYNFFQYSSGFGPGLVDVRVTSVDGDVIIVDNIQVSSDISITASGNFGSGSVSGSGSSVSPTTPETITTSQITSSTSTPPSSPKADGGVFHPSSTDDEAYPTGTTTATATAVPVTSTKATSLTHPTTLLPPSPPSSSTVTVYATSHCSSSSSSTSPLPVHNNTITMHPPTGTGSATATPVGPTITAATSPITAGGASNRATGMLIAVGLLVACFL